jgi:hypothetical protein
MCIWEEAMGKSVIYVYTPVYAYGHTHTHIHTHHMLNIVPGTGDSLDNKMKNADLRKTQIISNRYNT